MISSRTLQGAVALLVASALLTGCVNNSAQNNAATNPVGISSVNQVGLPGLTHGANLRSDRNLEHLVNAIPGVSTTSVLVTGNTAYVLPDAGSATGKGGTGTADTTNLTGGRKLGTGPGTGTGVNTKGPAPNYSHDTRTGRNLFTRNQLPNVGTSSTQSVATDLQTQITTAIKSGNPAIENIYFVTKAQ